jgi:hypothetical protein
VQPTRACICAAPKTIFRASLTGIADAISVAEIADQLIDLQRRFGMNLLVA